MTDSPEEAGDRATASGEKGEMVRLVLLLGDE